MSFDVQFENNCPKPEEFRRGDRDSRSLWPQRWPRVAFIYGKLPGCCLNFFLGRVSAAVPLNTVALCHRGALSRRILNKLLFSALNFYL